MTRRRWSSDEIRKLKPERVIDGSEELVRKMRALFADKHPAIVSVALADCSATWAAGHSPNVRKKMLNMHIELIRSLTRVAIAVYDDTDLEDEAEEKLQ